MLSHSVEFEAAVLGPHTIVVVVEVLSPAGSVLTTLDGTISGTVSVDRRASIRRTTSLEVVDLTGTITPANVGDLLLPYGTEVRVNRGIQLSTTVEAYPLGVFLLNVTEVNERDGGLTIHLEGSDRAARVSRPLVTPYTVTPQTNYADAIAGLFLHAWQTNNPGVTVPPFQVSPTTHATPNLFYDQQANAWDAIQEMATSCGMEAYFNVSGSFICRPLPAGSTALTWRYVDGMSDTRVSLNRRWDAADSPNYVVVQAAHSSVSPTVSATAQDTEADSPTYVSGPYGIVAEFVKSVLAVTEVQCQAEADARLAFSMAGVDTIDVDAVPFVVQEEGDLVLVQREHTRLDRYYLVDTIEFPLAHEPMSLGLARPFNVDPIIPVITAPPPVGDTTPPTVPGTPTLIEFTSSGAPVADFTATVVSGIAPLTVQFTDTSTQLPTSWAWDFQNNGSTDSTVQNPSFTYTTPGTYTVKLTATNSFGSDPEIKTGFVTVTAAGSAPVANFTANQTSGNAPFTVQFTDTSTNLPTSWQWDFQNNGSVDSTARHPSFTFTSAGTYTVKLTATNAFGTDDEIKTNLITVATASTVAIELATLPISARETQWQHTSHGGDAIHTYQFQGAWYQIAVFAVRNGGRSDPAISRRTLPDGTWSAPVNLADKLRCIVTGCDPDPAPVFMAADNHNVLCCAVDTLGYIHVMGNMHSYRPDTGSKGLRYCRSNSPNTLGATNGSGFTTRTMTNGVIEQAVTYPQFIKLQNGRLLASWRHVPTPGSRLSAIITLVRLADPATADWNVGVPGGKWIDGTITNPTRGAYMHRVVTENAGRGGGAAGAGVLHAFWTWRSSETNGTWHEDFCYVKGQDNDDNGNFIMTKADGTVFTMPLSYTNCENVISTNQSTEITSFGVPTLDTSNRIHAAINMPVGNGASPETITGTTGSRHVYWNGTAWIKNQIATSSATDLFSTPDGGVYAITGGGYGPARSEPGHQFGHRTLTTGQVASGGGPMHALLLTPGAAGYGTTNNLIVDVPTYTRPSTYDHEAMKRRNELVVPVGPLKAHYLDGSEPENEEVLLNSYFQWSSSVQFDLSQWASIYNGTETAPAITVAQTSTKSTSQTITSATPVHVSSLQGPNVVWTTYGAGNPSGKRALFVRLTITASVTSNGTVIHVAPAETNGSTGAFTYTGRLIFDGMRQDGNFSIASITRTTPWLPLMVLGTTSVHTGAPIVRAWRQAGTGSATITSGTYEFGVMNYYET